jgi:hypothetical protein
MNNESSNDLLIKLQSFGDPLEMQGWNKNSPNYVAILDLDSRHIPELVRMAQSWKTEIEPDKEVDWIPFAAPIHAWRALGQMQAVEIIQPLLDMMKRLDEIDDDWYMEEFPRVFALIGPPALAPLTEYIENRDSILWGRIVVAGALADIVKHHPETREQVLELLNKQLAEYEVNDYDFNAELVCALLDIKAVESAELIEKAYASNRVEETIVGWSEVKEELGVAGTGLIPANKPQKKITHLPFFLDDNEKSGPTKDKTIKEKAEKKKRKQADKSKKRNRKRK